MMLKYLTVFIALLAVLCCPAAVIDSIQFGDPGSEKVHHFSDTGSERVAGALNEPARQLAAGEPESWQGGSMKFKLRVNPKKLNYATVKLWGEDVSENMLILHINGRQVGFRRFGDIDILDHGSSEETTPGRFCYVTVPLPASATYGKDEVELEISATGPISGGGTFEEYQKPMKTPSRGIYKFYVHDDGFFTPPFGDRQGQIPEPAVPVKEEVVFDKLEARVNRDLEKLLKAEAGFTNQLQMLLAAEAYRADRIQNPQLAEKVAAGLDHYFRLYRKDPKFIRSDRATPNPDLQGFGLAAQAFLLLEKELQPLLDREVEDGAGKPVPRRKAWAEMFEATVGYLSGTRRGVASQSMIVDLNLYQANRALKLLDPSKGVPPEQALGFLYESVGLKPWSGKLDKSGKPSWPFGNSYYLVTGKGLTREFGYSGKSGEMLGWAAWIYDATRPEPDAPGDPKILGRLLEMIRARSFFRYPVQQVMRLESAIGWRDTEFPGEVTYAETPSRDFSALAAPATALDQNSTGFARQLFEDQQFSKSLEGLLKDGSLRATMALLRVPRQYELLKQQPPSSARLPMSAGQPDCVFSDEEAGVVAFKDGEDIFYASLYWRARNAVNFLARVHHITPELERVATVREEIGFEPSGLTYNRPNWTNVGYGNGGLRYPGKIDSAHTGETLPIAKIPEGVAFRPGQENPYAGRGEWYCLSYGPYLIGMNASREKNFQLTVPAGHGGFRLLPDGKTFDVGAQVTVAPMSTVVLKRSEHRK